MLTGRNMPSPSMLPAGAPPANLPGRQSLHGKIAGLLQRMPPQAPPQGMPPQAPPMQGAMPPQAPPQGMPPQGMPAPMPQQPPMMGAPQGMRAAQPGGSPANMQRAMMAQALRG